MLAPKPISDVELAAICNKPKRQSQTENIVDPIAEQKVYSEFHKQELNVNIIDLLLELLNILSKNYKLWSP